MAPPYSTVLLHNGDEKTAPAPPPTHTKPEPDSGSDSGSDSGTDTESDSESDAEKDPELVSRMTCSLGRCCTLAIEDDGREADLCDWFVFSATAGMALLTVLTTAVVVGILVYQPDPHGVVAYFIDIDGDKPCPHAGGGKPMPHTSPFLEDDGSGAGKAPHPPLDLAPSGVLKILVQVCLGLMVCCGGIFMATEVVRSGIVPILQGCRRGRRRKRRHHRRRRHCHHHHHHHRCHRHKRRAVDRTV